MALAYYFCSLERRVLPENLPFEIAKRAFVLESFCASFCLLKHQKISQQELENKIGSLETKEEPTFHSKTLFSKKKKNVPG